MEVPTNDKERGPQWETISAEAFLAEVKAATQNALMQKMQPMEAEQMPYAFDEVRIQTTNPNSPSFAFKDPAYTITDKFVIIGKRGHGRKGALSLSKVGGPIIGEISIYISSLQDPGTKIEVRRREDKRTGW